MTRAFPPPLIAVSMLAAGTMAACRAAAPPPAPTDVRPVVRAETASSSATSTPAGATERGRRGYTPADVRFMQHMIAHHAQALEMTALVPARSKRDDLRLLAQRIEVSQKDEIALMRRWLADRGEEAPSVEARHAHHEPSTGSGQQAAAGEHARMPGMLTAEQLAELASATGADFDQRFLEYMIRHHEGALQMVAALFATQGAGQEPAVYQFASDVDASQTAEIARLRALEGAPRPAAPRR